MAAPDHVCWFEDLRLKDVPAVGGKNASLGELRALQGVRVPEGFALTAQAYREALAEAGPGENCIASLGFRPPRCQSLPSAPLKARQIVYGRPARRQVAQHIAAAYRSARKGCGARSRSRGAQLGDCGGSADRQFRRAA